MSRTVAQHTYRMHLITSAVLLLLLATLIPQGEGISCYVCNSKQDPRCLDPFESENTTTSLETVDCEQDNNVRAALETVANLMTKLGQAPARDQNDVLAKGPQPEDPIPASCQKIDLTVLGEKVTGRGCSVHQMDTFNPCDAVKLVTTTSDVTLNFCGVCSTDGCNASARHLGQQIAVVALLTAALVNWLTIRK